MIVESSDSEKIREENEMPIPEGMYPPDTPAQVFKEDNAWGNRLPTTAEFERFIEMLRCKFRGVQGFPKDQMTNWMVREMI